eukprot:350244-Chlamydomonas_euryale.AAC.1
MPTHGRMWASPNSSPRMPHLHAMRLELGHQLRVDFVPVPVALVDDTWCGVAQAALHASNKHSNKNSAKVGYFVAQCQHVHQPNSNRNTSPTHMPPTCQVLTLRHALLCRAPPSLVPTPAPAAGRGAQRCNPSSAAASCGRRAAWSHPAGATSHCFRFPALVHPSHVWVIICGVFKCALKCVSKRTLKPSFRCAFKRAFMLCVLPLPVDNNSAVRLLVTV